MSSASGPLPQMAIAASARMQAMSPAYSPVAFRLIFDSMASPFAKWVCENVHSMRHGLASLFPTDGLPPEVVGQKEGV